MSDLSPHRGPYLTVQRRDGTADAARVDVAGELDLASTALLEAVLRTAMDAGHQVVYLDARDLLFCDASGFKLLVEISTEMRVRGGRLMILGPCPALDMLLQLTEHGDGALEVVPVEPADGGDGHGRAAPGGEPPSEESTQDDVRISAAP